MLVVIRCFKICKVLTFIMCTFLLFHVYDGRSSCGNNRCRHAQKRKTWSWHDQLLCLPRGCYAEGDWHEQPLLTVLLHRCFHRTWLPLISQRLKSIHGKDSPSTSICFLNRAFGISLVIGCFLKWTFTPKLKCCYCFLMFFQSMEDISPFVLHGRNKERHMGLERHDGEYIMTHYSV